MEVPDEILDGQHVRCPFCGEKTTYQRPKRIELPREVNRKGDVAESRSSVTLQGEVAKPKLSVRRPAKTVGSDPNFEAISRKLEINQQKRCEAAQQQQALASGSRLIWTVLAVVSVLLLIGGAAVCFLKASRKAEDRVPMLAVDQEKVFAEREKSLKAELAAIRAQMERLVAPTNQDKMKDDVAAVSQADIPRSDLCKERVDEKVIAQNELADDKIRQGVERFRWAERQFQNASALPFSLLPTYKKPGACDGDFVLISIDMDGKPEYHLVHSKAGGECLVEALNSNGVVQKVYYGELQEKLKTFGGFVCSGNVAYVLAPEDDSGSCRLSEEAINPAKVRLGELYDLMREKGLNVNDLSFELWLKDMDGRDAVFVSVSKFGETVDMSKILDLYRNVARKIIKKPAGAKPMKRTVVFYDGSIPKKLLNGVMLVPRNPINPTRAWRSLRDEAERQELLAHAGPSEEEWKTYDDQIEKTARRLVSKATAFVVMKQASREEKVPGLNSRVETDSEPTAEHEICRRTSEELKRLIKEKKEEHLNLRKRNPACVMKKDLRNIRNLEYRLLGREDKRYYHCKNVTYVREVFYCTKCKGDFERHYCEGSKASAPIWRAARDKVSETLEINAKIDVVLKQIANLEKELKMALFREQSIKAN